MGRLQVRSTLFFSCFLASSVQADLVISSGRSLGLQACRSVDFASLQCHVFFAGMKAWAVKFHFGFPRVRAGHWEGSDVVAGACFQAV